MVADDQRVALRGVVGDALRDEVGQRRRIAGVDVAEVRSSSALPCPIETYLAPTQSSMPSSGSLL